jgi:hypothetical protein
VDIEDLRKTPLFTLHEARWAADKFGIYRSKATGALLWPSGNALDLNELCDQEAVQRMFALAGYDNSVTCLKTVHGLGYRVMVGTQTATAMSPCGGLWVAAIKARVKLNRLKPVTQEVLT